MGVIVWSLKLTHANDPVNGKILLKNKNNFNTNVLSSFTTPINNVNIIKK